MFDQNDLTKAAFEPVLLTPLQRAQKDGYVNIIGAEGKKKIEYITLEKHVENYEDPEEKVRANFFAELIYKYEYPASGNCAGKSDQSHSCIWRIIKTAACNVCF